MQSPYLIVPTHAKVKMEGEIAKVLAKDQAEMKKKFVFQDWKKINEQRADKGKPWVPWGEVTQPELAARVTLGWTTSDQGWHPPAAAPAPGGEPGAPPPAGCWHSDCCPPRRAGPVPPAPGQGAAARRMWERERTVARNPSTPL